MSRPSAETGEGVAAAPAPCLEIAGLTKRFGELEVLSSVDLTQQRGEVLFIIGPSGSGKSTLLRCINRLEEPTAGRIVVDGTEMTRAGVDLNRARRNVGFVFQQFNLYPHMTAMSNVTFALRKVLKLDRRAARARGQAALDDVGLSDKYDAYPAELSGGQQQRVAIARALVMEPAIMLFDEPTSALDPELVDEVLAVIRKMVVRGMTMIVVSHEMFFAREAADRVVFMDAGRIVEQGPPDRLFNAPEQSRTKTFLRRFLRE